MSKGKAIILPSPQLVVASDASLQGWGAASQGQTTGGPWAAVEKKEHTNIAELKAAKLTIRTFTGLYSEVKSIHIQMDNIIVFSYTVKIGGLTTRNCQT